MCVCEESEKKYVTGRNTRNYSRRKTGNRMKLAQLTDKTKRTNPKK